MESKRANMKAEKMDFVAEHVLRIILARGLRGLSYAQVAKSSGVSRAWLYKYVGQTKDELMSFAVDHFGKIYTGLHSITESKTKDEYIDFRVASLVQFYERTMHSPWILPLYYRYFGSQTVIGKTIDKLEDAYIKKVSTEIKKFLAPKKCDPKYLAEYIASYNLMMAFRLQTLHKNDKTYISETSDYLRRFLNSIA